MERMIQQSSIPVFSPSSLSLVPYSLYVLPPYLTLSYPYFLFLFIYSFLPHPSLLSFPLPRFSLVSPIHNEQNKLVILSSIMKPQTLTILAPRAFAQLCLHNEPVNDGLTDG